MPVVLRSVGKPCPSTDGLSNEWARRSAGFKQVPFLVSNRPHAEAAVSANGVMVGADPSVA